MIRNPKSVVVTDPETISRLVKLYNEYVREYNAYETDESGELGSGGPRQTIRTVSTWKAKTILFSVAGEEYSFTRSEKVPKWCTATGKESVYSRWTPYYEFTMKAGWNIFVSEWSWCYSKIDPKKIKTVKVTYLGGNGMKLEERTNG